MSNERLELSLARELNSLIPSLKDPRIPLVVTVERVNLSKDGKTAKVLVSTLNEEDMADLLAALDRSKGYLQSQLAQSMQKRFTPRLSFFGNLLDVLT